MGKILWADTETGGLDPNKNALLELAAIVEIDGEIEDEILVQFKPLRGKEIHPKALEVNGKTLEEIKTYPNHQISLLRFKRMMEQHINKFDPSDKFVLAGYNIGFDANFLRNAFSDINDKYYGSYFFNCNLDVWSEVAKLISRTDLRLPNYKLGTVCDAFNIKINPHESKSDIEATRLLYYKLQEEYATQTRECHCKRDPEILEQPGQLLRKKTETVC